MPATTGGPHHPRRVRSAPSGSQAFSINYADICIRWGLYESALRYVGWPIIPGFDLAGEVEVAGAESGFSVGDRVFGCSFFGAYASRCSAWPWWMGVVVPAWQVMKMPQDMSFASAAALPAVVLTALHAVKLVGPVLMSMSREERGRDALVHSAAGGVGDMLCQLLRIYGLRVVGVVGSRSKVSSCKARKKIGCAASQADVVIDKSSEDWVRAAQKHAPDGYRAIFDANGVATLKAATPRGGGDLTLTARYGFHSNLPKCDGGLGALSPLNWIRMAIDLARTPHFDPMFLTLDSKAVLGFNLSFFSEEIETGEAYLSQLKAWVHEGKIQVPPVRSFAFQNLREAHNALTSGQSVGKMVERLYGLSNPQGNHGEDVKEKPWAHRVQEELYYYLDATPTHSYMRMLYKYPQAQSQKASTPQAEFPYDELRRVNFERKKDPLLLTPDRMVRKRCREYELLDTGIFDENRYFDVEIEPGILRCPPRNNPRELLVSQVLIAHPKVAPRDHSNRMCNKSAPSQAWFRNTWSWNHSKRPSMTYFADQRRIEILPCSQLYQTSELHIVRHEKLGSYNIYVDENTEVIFCENETNDVAAKEGAKTCPYKAAAALAPPLRAVEDLLKLGDFRSLGGAGWHRIHSLFGTRVGPKPEGAQETGKDQGFRYHLSGRTSGCFKDQRLDAFVDG
eukprot:Skav236532  [mRNA]  locus=scaffold78:1094282:1122857:- [translate_table: standard]